MDGNTEIYVCGADGKNSQAADFNESIDSSPSWSRDQTGGHLISTGSGLGQPPDLHHGRRGLQRPKGELRRLLSRRPRLVAHGRPHVYVSRVENIFDLYVLNLRNNQIVS